MEALPVGKEATILVQVSDIHFRHGKPSLETIQDDVKSQLLSDAAGICKMLPPVKGILVCGDIAFSGQKAEYATAREWLMQLCQRVQAQEENVWVVPGNHDVDRSEHKAPLLMMLHKAIRSNDINAVDCALDQYFKDQQSGELLFRPLRNYNEFAASYGCATTPGGLHWEQSFLLNDGSTFAIRGLNSVLVSGASDDEHHNRMVIGTAQCLIVEQEGREHLVMCHHPPNWLLDGSEVEKALKARARVYLFGHRHEHSIDKVNESLRIASGATIPEIGNGDWAPRYNILALEVATGSKGRILQVCVLARTWDPKTRKFTSEPNTSGKPFEVHELRLPNWSAAPKDTHSYAKPVPQIVPPIVSPSPPVPSMDPRRRLTYRFLLLPYYMRTEIAITLSLVRDEDRDTSETDRAGLYLKRAVEAKRLADLWDEVEKHHSDPAPSNPFRVGT